MKFALRLAWLVLLPGLLAQPAPVGAPPPALPALPSASALIKPAGKKPASAPWVFSLLPKSLQKNPNLELTVVTEMTEDGKKLPPVTPEQPAYYLTQSSGYHQLGDSTGNEKTLPEAEVERILTKALAPNGYRPAQPPAQPPTLMIFYTWGSHNLLLEPDTDNPTLSAQRVARNLLDRAALVGGTKFAKEMLQLFTQADALATASYTPPPPPGADASPGPVIDQAQMEFMNPVNLFKMKSPKNEFLVDQTADDVYYVVASAYDYRALQQKQRKLLWRTRMTVAAKGVSQEQSLPTLIATAAPYFGQDMPEAEVLIKRAVPDGKVEIGTPIVVESPAHAPADQTPAKP